MTVMACIGTPASSRTRQIESSTMTGWPAFANSVVSPRQALFVRSVETMLSNVPTGHWVRSSSVAFRPMASSAV